MTMGWVLDDPGFRDALAVAIGRIEMAGHPELFLMSAEHRRDIAGEKADKVLHLLRAELASRAGDR